MPKLRTPNTQLSLTLFKLLHQPVSAKSFPAGFRLSEYIRQRRSKNTKVLTVRTEFNTFFGRKSHHATYKLAQNKKDVIKVYNQIIDNKKGIQYV